MSEWAMAHPWMTFFLAAFVIGAIEQQFMNVIRIRAAAKGIKTVEKSE